MFRKMLILGFVGVLLSLLVTPVLAQGPVTPQHSDPTWQATYWNNTSLTGTPVLQREEANINYEWWTGTPSPGVVSADYFSARWTRYIDVTPGTYVFSVTSDDGIRVWVDDTLVIDKWYVHPPTTFTADVYLGSGHHLIKVEYFEEAGVAVAKLQWYLKSQPTTGEWKAEYYNNRTLAGTPTLVRNEAAVNYDWGTGSPQPGNVNSDNFSARWTRTLNTAGGNYTFWVTADDGVRLWVNGHLLVDAWYEQAATTYSDEIYIPAGSFTIEVQYFEAGGLAVAKLDWSTSGGPTPPTPPSGAVIVDDGDSGFVTGGSATGWRRVTGEGYNGDLTWTYNNYSVQYNYNWARWYPNLAAGRYEVFVYIPDRYTTTGQARYWVSHAGGYTLRIVNQSTNGGRWVSLGTYQFSGGSGEYVSLADVTYEPYRSRLIGFDAVKWEPR
ncbi:MAG: PA14 domain-containing protein [Anaerolineae bacterium]